MQHRRSAACPVAAPRMRSGSASRPHITCSRLMCLYSEYARPQLFVDASQSWSWPQHPWLAGILRTILGADGVYYWFKVLLASIYKSKYNEGEMSSSFSTRHTSSFPVSSVCLNASSN